MQSLLSHWRHRPTHRQVWALAAPMILSNLSVPLVTLVDSAVAGHLPRAEELGAVALGGGLYTALLGILTFMRMGTTGFAAQANGRGDGSALRGILLQGLLMAALLGAGLVCLSESLGGRFIDSLQASPQISALTLDFLGIRLLGLPAALGSYVVIGWLLGLRDARSPLLILLLTNVANIVLCTWLALGLGLAGAGIALASVIAEWCGLLLGLWLVLRALRRVPGRVLPGQLRRWANWKPLLLVNRDILIRSLAIQLVFLLVAVQGARLGDAVVAANALLLNGVLVASFALDGLAHAVEALAGNAIGARDGRALRGVLTVAGGWSLLLSLLFAAALGFGGELFIELQTDIASVRAVAHSFIPYLALMPLIAVWSYLLDGLFIGATRAREMRNAMLLAVALGLPLGFLTRPLGNHGLWLALLTFTALRGAIQGYVTWRLFRADAWTGDHGLGSLTSQELHKP